MELNAVKCIFSVACFPFLSLLPFCCGLYCLFSIAHLLCLLYFVFCILYFLCCILYVVFCIFAVAYIVCFRLLICFVSPPVHISKDLLLILRLEHFWNDFGGTKLKWILSNIFNFVILPKNAKYAKKNTKYAKILIYAGMSGNNFCPKFTYFFGYFLQD